MLNYSKNVNKNHPSLCYNSEYYGEDKSSDFSCKIKNVQAGAVLALAYSKLILVLKRSILMDSSHNSCILSCYAPGGGSLQKFGQVCAAQACQVFKNRGSGTDFFGLKLGSPEQIFAKIYISGAKNIVKIGKYWLKLAWYRGSAIFIDFVVYLYWNVWLSSLSPISDLILGV